MGGHSAIPLVWHSVIVRYRRGNKCIGRVKSYDDCQRLEVQQKCYLNPK